MARIAGINIPMNKHVWVGLTHIYGVGRARAREACKGAGVNPSTKVKDLTEQEVNAIRSQIAKFAVPSIDIVYESADERSQITYLRLKEVIARWREGMVSRRLKEMIATYVSALNRCPY